MSAQTLLFAAVCLVSIAPAAPAVAGESPADCAGSPTACIARIIDACAPVHVNLPGDVLTGLVARCIHAIRDAASPGTAGVDEHRPQGCFAVGRYEGAVDGLRRCLDEVVAEDQSTLTR